MRASSRGPAVLTAPLSSAPEEALRVSGRPLQLHRLIASGGGGTVFEATHASLNVTVAVKILREGPDGPCPRRAARFLREARVAARLESPHAVRVLDVVADEGAAPYMVMEYLEGETLQARLRGGGPLPLAEAVGYILDATLALAEMHGAGIVHRDIKPSNLFLARRRDGTTILKVLDFGLATPDGEEGEGESLTRSEGGVGTPLYMAPEQYASAKYVDARVDVWSLGVTLYELLTGRSPFDAPTFPETAMRILRSDPDPLSSHRPDVPEGVVDVVRWCLEKDPAHRLPDVLTLRRSLAPFAAPEGAPPPSLSPGSVLGSGWAAAPGEGARDERSQHSSRLLLPAEAPLRGAMAPRPFPLRPATGVAGVVAVGLVIAWLVALAPRPLSTPEVGAAAAAEPQDADGREAPASRSFELDEPSAAAAPPAPERPEPPFSAAPVATPPAPRSATRLPPRPPARVRAVKPARPSTSPIDDRIE